MEQHLEAIRTQVMQTPRTVTYNVQIEEGPNSFGAEVVELPGCFAVAPTREEVLQRIHEAAVMHLRSMIEDGEEIPAPVEVFQEAFQLA